MANDNTLKAPAEGFGQNITFSFRPDPRDTPSLDGLGRSGQTQARVYGSPTTGGLVQAQHVEAAPPNPTLQLLQKVAGDALRSQLQKKRAEAFVEGMQRAANGEAVKDIAEGQPWYAHIFGESDVVEGARTYTTQARVSEAAAAIEDNMPEVRKMDPDSAKGYFSELVSQHLTGDAATDAAVMQSFARTLPATMRRQAKEHYAWRQEEASRAESAAFMSAADLLQKRATGDKQTDGEYAAEAVKLIAGMRPAVGRDVESWTKARTADVLNLAQAGKFHAVNAVRASGLLDLLPADARTKIESAIDTAENRTVSNKLFEYAPDIAKIAAEAEVYSTDLSPEGSAAQLKALNERFRKETGIDRDLVSLEKGTGILKDARVTILREGERRIREGEQAAKAAAAEGDKARAEALTKLGASQAIGLGQAGAAARVLPDSIVHQQFMDAWRTAGAKGGPAAQAQLLMLNYSGAGSGDGYVNPAIKDLYERRAQLVLGGTGPTTDFMQLHDEWSAMHAQNPALADAYLGKMAGRMAYYDQLLVPGNPGSRNELAAYTAAFGPDEPKPKALGKKEFATAVKNLEDQHDASWWKFLSQQREPLRSDQSQQAVAALQPRIERFMALPGMTPDEAVRRALEASKREEGSDLLGGFFIRGGAGMQPLTNILRTFRSGDSAKGTGEDANDVWDKALKGIVANRGERVGADLDKPIAIYRNPDVKGVAWLDVYYTPKNGGAPIPVRISSDDIKNFQRDPSGHTAGGPVTN